jgi:hypothetical protein
MITSALEKCFLSRSNLGMFENSTEKLKILFRVSYFNLRFWELQIMVFTNDLQTFCLYLHYFPEVVHEENIT